jgi:hypothetical protein
MGDIKELLRDAWTGVFLDGRNEHGTHVLTLPHGTIDQDPKLYALEEYAEQIMVAAEKAGHTAGHCVVVTWKYIDGGYDTDPSYWDLTSAYQPELTALLFGTAAEQQTQLDEMAA